MIFIEPLRTTSTSAGKAAEQSTFCHLAFKLAKDYVTESGWQGLAGFRGPQQNPSELSESVYLQIFATKTSFFNCGKTGHLWLSKDLHTHRRVPSNTLLDVSKHMYFYKNSSKALQNLSESRLTFVESLSKAS